MKRRLFRHLISASVVALLAVSSPLAAQSRLYVLEPSDGQFHRVLRIREDRPFIMEKGSLSPAAGARYALKGVDEFLPCFVAVNHRKVEFTGWNFMGRDPNLAANRQVHFSAEFETPFSLEDVFLVLELEFTDGGGGIVAREVGRLGPRAPLEFTADINVEGGPALRHCTVHLFARGSEVFTSEQTEAFREEMMGRMIKSRLASVRQAGPSLLFGPAPGYPEALRKTGVKGRAVVAVRITPTGGVADPAVESASDPAFGEAALSAVRGWRFVPCVKDGRAVEARVSIPFAFDPAAPAGG